MTAIVLSLWPLSGILGLWLATPPWMRKADPIGFGIMHLTACIGGPFLLAMGVFYVMRGAGINKRAPK